jgi:hypothetical protein
MINELVPVFVEYIPSIKEEGKIYISEKFEVAIHLCACGCGQQTVMPLNKKDGGGWKFVKDGDLLTFRPSIGNFIGEDPYHAHYYITNNKIEWL